MIMKVLEKLNQPITLTSKHETVARDPQYFSEEEIIAFKEGAHTRLYEKMGAHLMTFNNVAGCYFAVWAPAAKRVSVVGAFNAWNKRAHVLTLRADRSGIWEGFVPGALNSDPYKFHVTSKMFRRAIEKADPYAFQSESAPKTSSIIFQSDYSWKDQKWLNARKKDDFSKSPMAVYEVHLGSWRRKKDGSFLSYREIAPELIAYVKDMGFTHIEFMPLMEHPFYGSWGYQALGYFAPTGRYGSPDDLKFLIDECHKNNIGIILDWVASHFPYDEYGIANFDGSKLYEYDEIHPEWQSCMFNLGKNQTIEFLISNVMYWIEHFHVDGLRVDAVASMLYLDYARQNGQWTPNFFGGKQNLDSIAFLRRLNETVKDAHPDVLMIAEDSTAWPRVTQPNAEGGLHFDMKWNMGWMHDSLKYFCRKSSARGRFHNELAFCLHYAFSENYVLSLSHDEVVYAKGSLIGKMPEPDRFPNLRVLLGFMYGHPGKKLLFMGNEFAQWGEWNHDAQLEWNLLEYDRHQHIQHWVKDLNKIYKSEAALHEQDFTAKGFDWIDMGLNKESVFSFLRKGVKPQDEILILCNFKNKSKKGYSVPLLKARSWNVALNSDDPKYGGRGKFKMNAGAATVDLPALSVIFLKRNNLDNSCS